MVPDELEETLKKMEDHVQKNKVLLEEKQRLNHDETIKLKLNEEEVKLMNKEIEELDGVSLEDVNKLHLALQSLIKDVEHVNSMQYYCANLKSYIENELMKDRFGNQKLRETLAQLRLQVEEWKKLQVDSILEKIKETQGLMEKVEEKKQNTSKLIMNNAFKSEQFKVMRREVQKLTKRLEETKEKNHKAQIDLAIKYEQRAQTSTQAKSQRIVSGERPRKELQERERIKAEFDKMQMLKQQIEEKKKNYSEIKEENRKVLNEIERKVEMLVEAKSRNEFIDKEGDEIVKTLRKKDDTLLQVLTSSQKNLQNIMEKIDSYSKKSDEVRRRMQIVDQESSNARDQLGHLNFYSQLQSDEDDDDTDQQIAQLQESIEKLKAEKAGKARIEAESVELQRIETEKIKYQKIEAEKVEQQRLEAESLRHEEEEIQAEKSKTEKEATKQSSKESGDKKASQRTLNSDEEDSDAPGKGNGKGADLSHRKDHPLPTQPSGKGKTSQRTVSRLPFKQNSDDDCEPQAIVRAKPQPFRRAISEGSHQQKSRTGR